MSDGPAGTPSPRPGPGDRCPASFRPGGEPDRPETRTREEAIRFAGYAAVFDRVDRGGDVVRAGAFGALPRDVPLLWQHGGAPVGTVERVAEDARGLRVIGRIAHPRLAALVEAGAVTGLSFGYRVKTAGSGRVRELRAIELVEVSLVAQPMQPLARVHAVERRRHF